MRLGVRSFLVVSVLVGAGVIVSVFAARTQVLRGFDELEEQEAQARASHVARLFSTLTRDYRVQSQDWAEWNDMVRYLATGDPEWEGENLMSDSFITKDWAQMAVVRSSDLGRVYTHRYDGKELVAPTAGFEALIDARGLVPKPGEERAVDGFVVLDGALWTIAAQPIVNTDRTAGPEHGVLVYGRPVDAKWIARAEELTSLDLDVRLLDEAKAAGGAWARGTALVGTQVSVEPVDATNLASYVQIADVDGRPVAVLQIIDGRPASEAGHAVLDSITRGLILGGALAAILTIVLVRRMVVEPIERVAKGARALEAGLEARVTGLPDDEIGELGSAFNRMARTIREREAALRRSVAQVARVLDNTGDALAACDLHGTLVGPASATATAWFGDAKGPASAWLFDDQPERAALFDLGLEELRAAVMPDELVFEQMPTRFVRDGRAIALTVRRIELDAGEPGLLLIGRDVTADVARERSQAEARELQAVIGRLLRDRADFQRFIIESEALFEAARCATDPGALRRALHTLKGNMAVFGFQSVADAAHAAEDRLRDDPSADPRTLVAPVMDVWWSAVMRVANDVPLTQEAQVEVEPNEVVAVAEALKRIGGAAGLSDRIAAWLTAPVRRLLQRSADTALRVAGQLGRRIEVRVEAADIRVDADATWALWSAMGHVVRNAVDHGIEPPDERVALGKDPVGTITLRAWLSQGLLVLAVEDDGRGVDWARLARSATARGLPTHTHADLVEAMFADGVSTKDVVTEISGRGVGMSAIRTAVNAVGGHIEVISTAGASTTISVVVPATVNGRTVAVSFDPIDDLSERRSA